MDAKQFALVDGILATKGFHDDRQAAMDIIEAGAREDTLADAAQVVAGRYALQPMVVIEWFVEVLKRRVQDAQGQLNQLKELTKDHV